METFENIKRLRIERGLSQDELAKRTGYTDRSSIAKIEAGKVDLSESKIILFAKALNVTPAALMSIEGGFSVPSGFQTMPEMENATPLVGDIACGTPILADENIRDYIPTPRGWRADFALECHGDSMAPKILDGDIVAIRKQSRVENGQIAAVRIQDEATLKRVFFSPGQLILQAENPAYAPILLIGENIADAEIEGLAVGIMRNI